MKKILILAMMLMIGCDAARVLSFDGSRRIAYCSQYSWTKCMSEACPDGFTIVDDTAEVTLVKCKVKP